MLKRLKLVHKIAIFIIAILIVSITTTVTFISYWKIDTLQKEIERNVMNIAEIAASSPIVIEGLKGEVKDNKIQPYVEYLLKNTTGTDLIVIANMDAIRYGHPNPKLLGGHFSATDHERALKEGVKYISEGPGTLGRSLRAFVPVVDYNGDRLGFVLVGSLTDSIIKMKKDSVVIMIVFSFIGVGIGALGAVALSVHIKKILLNFEPEEIARMFTEKKSILEAIHEGLIAVDSQSNITLVNDSAIELLQIKEQNVLGKKVSDVFPSSMLPQVMQSGESVLDHQHVLNETIVISNTIPIRGEQGVVVGGISSFRDKTMVSRLAEEVTGVRKIVDALRANTHEFMNKLHVILGMIETESLDEAKKYIANINQHHQGVVNLVISKIKDPTVAALIIGKFSRAAELYINMTMNKSSNLDFRSGRINSNVMVTIVGNLIENAMDAVIANPEEHRTVFISLTEDAHKIYVTVKDNGVGIKDENLNRIFERGFTTKNGSRGIGLALVLQNVDQLKGEITVDSKLGEGTEFRVSLPKEA